MHQWFDSAVQALIAVLALCALVISGIALIPGFIALKRAREANELASGANVISSGANALSAQANQTSAAAHELALQSARRETESHDVIWKLGYRDESAFILVNQGLDVAYRVRVAIRAYTASASLTRESTLKPWDHFDIPATLDTALKKAFIETGPVHMRVHWFSEAGSSYSLSLVFDGADVVAYGPPVG